MIESGVIRAPAAWVDLNLLLLRPSVFHPSIHHGNGKHGGVGELREPKRETRNVAERPLIDSLVDM